MPKELFEIRNFHKGIISTPSEEDIPPNAASYSLDVESVAVDGKLTGRKSDETKGIHDSTSMNSSAFINSEVAEDDDLIYHDGTGFKSVRNFYETGLPDPDPPIYYDGEENGTILVDADASFPVDELVGMQIKNLTDGSSGIITSNTATSITHSAIFNVVSFEDGPTEDESDTYITAHGHGFVNGQTIVIAGSDNYDSSAIVISDVEENKFAIATGYIEESASRTTVSAPLSGGTTNLWTGTSILTLDTGSFVADTGSFDGGDDGTYNDCPTTTDGSGVGALVTTVITSGNWLGIAEGSNNGTGYQVGDTLTVTLSPQVANANDDGTVEVATVTTANSYSIAPVAKSLATIEAGGYVNMVKNNKELHIGMGNNPGDAPRWIGYNNHQQWGEDNTGIKYENAELISHDIFGNIYKAVWAGSHFFGISSGGTNVFKFDVTTEEYVGKSEDGLITSARAIAIDIPRENIYIFDDRGSDDKVLIQMSLDLSIVYEKTLQASATNIDWDATDMECASTYIFLKKEWDSSGDPNGVYIPLYKCQFPTSGSVSTLEIVTAHLPYQSDGDWNVGEVGHQNNDGAFMGVHQASEASLPSVDEEEQTLILHKTENLCLTKSATSSNEIIIITTPTCGRDTSIRNIGDVSVYVCYTYYAHSGDNTVNSYPLGHHTAWFIHETHNSYTLKGSTSTCAAIRLGGNAGDGIGGDSEVMYEDCLGISNLNNVTSTTAYIAHKVSANSSRIKYFVKFKNIADYNSRIGSWGSTVWSDTLTGTITAFAPGSNTTVTSNGHGLANAQSITITGSTSYDGTELITSNVTTNTFDIPTAFTTDTAAGSWERPEQSEPQHYNNIDTKNSGAGTYQYINYNEIMFSKTVTIVQNELEHIHVFEGSSGGKWGKKWYPSVASNAWGLVMQPVSRSILDVTVENDLADNSFPDPYHEYKFFYKISYTYDGYQESPLCPTTFTLATGSNRKKITLKIYMADTLPSRISHVNIYRAENSSDTAVAPNTLFRLVTSLKLDQSWEKIEDADWGEYRKYIYNDIAYGSITATYNSLTGISELMPIAMVNRNLSTSLNNVLYIADCSHPNITNADLYMFKSLPFKFDMIDWSRDFLILPERPKAIAAFNGRIWAFSDNNTYRIEPNSLFIEDTFNGTGCSGPNSFVITEYGMCYADGNNIYLHDGSLPKPIGDAILKSNDGFGYQELYSDPPIVVFDGKRNSFVIFMDKTRAWSYNLARQKWDLWSLPATSDALNSVFTGKSGEMYVSKANTLHKYADSTSTKAWDWESKDIIVGQSTQNKKFYALNKVGDATVAIDGTPELPYESRKVKLIASGTTGQYLDSIGVVFRSFVKVFEGTSST